MGENVKRLVTSALFVGIATVLSLLKIDLPFGGGVTIVSMLPLILLSHRYGWKWGLFPAFAYGLIQLILGIDNVSYASTVLMAIGVVIFDYLLAFTVLGFSGVFGNSREGVAIGIAVTFFLRFLCHYITGVWIWGGWMPEEFMGLPMTSPWLYSFLYNGWYMMAETILTEIVAMVIYQPLKGFLRGRSR